MKDDPAAVGAAQPLGGARNHLPAHVEAMDFGMAGDGDQPFERAAVALPTDENAGARREPIEQTKPGALEIATEGSELEQPVNAGESIKIAMLHGTSPNAIAISGVRRATSASTRETRQPSLR